MRTRPVSAATANQLPMSPGALTVMYTKLNAASQATTVKVSAVSEAMNSFSSVDALMNQDTTADWQLEVSTHSASGPNDYSSNSPTAQRPYYPASIEELSQHWCGLNSSMEGAAMVCTRASQIHGLPGSRSA